MKGQSYIVEFIIMFGIAFALFSTVGFLFSYQTQSLSKKVGVSTITLLNDIIINDMMKSFICKACSEMTINENIPQKIGGFFYEASLSLPDEVTTRLVGSSISAETATFNLDESYSYSGQVNSNNKKMEIKINNIYPSTSIRIK